MRQSWIMKQLIIHAYVMFTVKLYAFLLALCAQQLHLQKVTSTIHKVWHNVTHRLYQNRSAQSPVLIQYENSHLQGSNCCHLLQDGLKSLPLAIFLLE